MKFSSLTLEKAAKIFEKILPGQVGLPISKFDPKKKLVVQVTNKKMENALKDAGFWTK